MKFLDPKPGGRFIDATLERVAYARNSRADRADGRVLRDRSRRAGAGQGRWRVCSHLVTADHGAFEFQNIAPLAAGHGFLEVEGVARRHRHLIDDGGRSIARISFMREAPLDMPDDRTQDLTAADVVNTYAEKEIADILYTYGEERRSRSHWPLHVRARPCG